LQSSDRFSCCRIKEN